MSNGRSAANVHRIGISVLAFGIELMAMRMAIEGAIEASAREQASPQGATGRTSTARIVGLVVKPEGDVVKQKTVVGPAKGATAGFLLQEAHLVLAEPRKIVQSVIDPSAIGLVLAAVEHDEARATP